MFNEQENNEDSKHIYLKVLGNDDSVVQFKYLRNAELSKLMDIYCERAGLSRHEARFIYKNARLFDEDTPLSLKMQNGDTIDVGRIHGNQTHPKVKNEPTSSDNSFINIKFMGQDGSNVQFRVKQNKKFENIINVYCDMANIDRREIRVRYDGAPVKDEDTPLTHKMAEGDTIEIFQSQYSG